MIIEELLGQAGYDVVLAADGVEGIERYREAPTDLVVTDMVMPGKMGADVILELKEEFPEAKFIALSAGGDFGPELELDMAHKLGAITIVKPVQPDQLLDAVKKMLG
jgi:CheY-like chemotaxis protein